MGGAGRQWSSWNHGSQAGNLRAELDRGKGESWGWGLRLLEAPSSGGETWISHEVGSEGKASWRGTPWRDRDTRNFGNGVVRAEVVEEIQAESSRNRSWLGVTGS